jgi:dipeptidyl-peptidase-4
MADDNVHPQNTVQLQDALQAANKQFDVMYYHGRNHRISGGNTDLHLHTLMTNFFLQNL